MWVQVTYIHETSSTKGLRDVNVYPYPNISASTLTNRGDINLLKCSKRGPDGFCVSPIHELKWKVVDCIQKEAKVKVASSTNSSSLGL